MVATLLYPKPPTGDHVDTYHGVAVPDPYRPLEDPDAPATRAWIEAENELTRSWFAQIPGLGGIRDRLSALWNYPRFGVPTHKGRYFFFKNDGLQNQAVLYAQDSLDGEPRPILDPNRFAADGTIAVTSIAPSEDGELIAYGKATGGSDWEELCVRDTAQGLDRPDVLHWVKFSGASWTHDHAGFFYSRYPESVDPLAPTRFQKLYYHRLGTPQDADVLVYERPDEPDWGFGGAVTDDGRYLIITVWVGTDRRTRVYYTDLGDPSAPKVGPVVRLLDAFDASYGFIGNDGPVFYFLTDHEAPRRRVVAIDIRTPDRAQWRELVPQGPDVLDHAQFVHDTLVVHALRDAHSVLRLHRATGEYLRDLPLPALGTVSALGGERRDTELFYSFTSFLHPTTIFRYDFRTGASEVFRAPALAFDATRYETEQVFYRSKDGTRIPMFITRKRDFVRDRSAPTLLSGYGGFNISLTPSFSPGLVVWLERGGIYAVPNLRGGGEYGEAWHEAGMKERKQNVFDDGIAAAEYLIAQGYTAASRLAITGGSNGGLLVGALMTQRPELFAAALPAVGVFDMLRFHKFTIGWAWVSEYGSADDPALFGYLYGYSPLHRLKAGTNYPATYITTADHDDRVVPAHSFKFAAALQAAGGPRPVLIEIETKAGHGAGKPIMKVIEEQAHRWAFLIQALGVA
ncbi:MAG TPA: prolyl oligopeptidase family serine peptidase [Gemmatimonadales bacterium]|nr:prolyl oligopeptidase family serine peptidase [Gemmatimonadales bacterium]